MPTPDVRVRLSAEGVKEVVDALKKVADEAGKAGKRGAAGLGALNTALGGTTKLMNLLGVAVSAVTFKVLIKDSIDAGDAMAKMSAKTGAAAEALSVLTHAGTTADASQESLQKGLQRTAISVEKLNDGSKEMVRTFAELGLSQQDFIGKDSAQAFAIIAERLGKVEDGTRKAAIANDLFSKSGQDLLPLINSIAKEGFPALEESARAAGAIITTETALLSEKVNDDFTKIGNEVKGVALQFTAGLLPSISQVMDEFKADVAGGSEEMEDFGREAGRVVRVVVAVFRLLGNIVTGVFASIADGVGATAAAAAQAFQGNFSEAFRIVKDRFQQQFTDIRDIANQTARDFERVVDEALTTEALTEVQVTVKRRGGAIDVESAEEEAERKKREAEAEKARKEAERKAKEAARIQQEAQEKLRDLNIQLLEDEGKRHEAFEANLAKELADAEKVLQTLGKSREEQEAFLARMEGAARSRFNFADTATQAQNALDALDRARERIVNNAQVGALAQFQAEKRVIELEQERLPVLKELSAALLAQAQALGQPDDIARAEEFANAVAGIEKNVAQATDKMQQFSDTAQDAFQSSLANTLSTLQDFEDVGDIFTSLASDVVSAIQRIAAEMIAQYATIALFRAIAGGFSGGGSVGGSATAGAGAAGFSDGGSVWGAGTATSDSIPAWLSNGEFVVRSAVVKQPGVRQFLEDLNDGLMSPQLRTLRGRGNRYADGGMVDGMGGGALSRQDSSLTIGLEEGLVLRQLDTPAGARVMIKQLGKNPRSAKQAIG